METVTLHASRPRQRDGDEEEEEEEEEKEEEAGMKQQRGHQTTPDQNTKVERTRTHQLDNTIMKEKSERTRRGG